MLGLVFETSLPRYRRVPPRPAVPPDRGAAVGGRSFSAGFSRRCCEQGGPWDEVERIIDGAVAKLNDYSATGRWPCCKRDQRIEPYAHEWVRPVPLYIRGAGVARGPLSRLISRSRSEILRATDPVLLREAHFDPELLDELALDPAGLRLRPSGQQAAQLPLRPVGPAPSRQPGPLPPVRRAAGDARRAAGAGRRSPASCRHEELLFEAAAVLAGTILMGSGISGSGPDAHDSTSRWPRWCRNRRLSRRLLRATSSRKLGGAARRAAAGRGGHRPPAVRPARGST